VICNSNLPVRDSFILVSDISDHYPIIFSVNHSPKKTKPKQTFQRNFSNDRLTAFGNALKNINWESVTSTNQVNVAYNNFEEIFNDLDNLYFSIIP